MFSETCEESIVTGAENTERRKGLCGHELVRLSAEGLCVLTLCANRSTLNLTLTRMRSPVANGLDMVCVRICVSK